MKQKLINSIKDFLTTIIGENENVWHYLENYVTSEINPPVEQIRHALDEFVQNLNEINVSLKKRSGQCKTIPLKPSTHSVNWLSDSATKSATQLSSDETIKDASPNKTSVRNGSSVSGFNKNLVQIVANKSEIERRIASFIECKRMDVDEENRREFCSDLYLEHGDAEQCARTSAVFVARSGGRSHVAVSRVVNANGPQLRVLSCTPSMTSLPKVKKEPDSAVPNPEENVAGGHPHIKQEPKDVPPGIEERLKNMEAHLKVTPPGSVSDKPEVFERLKALEKRILFLESISPEYFNLQLQSSRIKKRKILQSPLKNPESKNEIKEAVGENLSLVEIDERMKRLKNILMNKQLNLDNT